jgi:hypothetical protein
MYIVNKLCVKKWSVLENASSVCMIEGLTWRVPGRGLVTSDSSGPWQDFNVLPRQRSFELRLKWIGYFLSTFCCKHVKTYYTRTFQCTCIHTSVLILTHKLSTELKLSYVKMFILHNYIICTHVCTRFIKSHRKNTNHTPSNVQWF